MRIEKFNKYIGLGNLDDAATKTLVYSPVENELYVAHKVKDFPMISTGLAGGLTTISYVMIRNITIKGILPLLLSWLLSLTLGYIMARILRSVKVRIEEIEEVKLDLGTFLYQKLEEVSKLWKIILFLFFLSIIFAIYYLYMDRFVMLISSILLTFVATVIYFIGVHRRKAIIIKLLSNPSYLK